MKNILEFNTINADSNNDDMVGEKPRGCSERGSDTYTRESSTYLSPFLIEQRNVSSYADIENTRIGGGGGRGGRGGGGGGGGRGGGRIKKEDDVMEDGDIGEEEENAKAAGDIGKKNDNKNKNKNSKEKEKEKETDISEILSLADYECYQLTSKPKGISGKRTRRKRIFFFLDLLYFILFYFILFYFICSTLIVKFNLI